MNFFVPGIPKGQPRVRAVIRGRHAGVYDPGTANDWKASIAIAAKQIIQHTSPSVFPLYSGPVAVDCAFVFPRPKAHFRASGLIKPDAPVYHTSKPDRDNLDKAVLDILTQLQFWHDDSYVVEGTITKRYTGQDERCGALITITPLTRL